MTIRTYQGISPELGERVFIDPTAVVLGDVKLGDDASVWPGTVIRGDVNYIRIGARSNIQDNSIIHVSHAGEFNPDGAATIIGADVTVGHGAILHGCTLGDRVLVGMGAVVLDDTVVQDNVLIAAGSIVPPGKVLESGAMYVGSPARKIRELSDREIDFFCYSSAQYVKEKDAHLAENYVE